MLDRVEQRWYYIQRNTVYEQVGTLYAESTDAEERMWVFDDDNPANIYGDLFFRGRDLYQTEVEAKAAVLRLLEENAIRAQNLLQQARQQGVLVIRVT